MSFDMICGYVSEDWHQSQSLSNRAMSFDLLLWRLNHVNQMSQSLSNRAMSFDEEVVVENTSPMASQSLSNRAMSFDMKELETVHNCIKVSIPFEQGDVFRRLSVIKQQ